MTMRVIVYARVSTTKQDLDRQLMLAKEYCNVRGYELVGSIIEKMSGAKSDRDGLQQLMALTKNDCDLVVVSELSRITREEEFQRIFSRIDTLRDNGISVVFLDDPDNVYSNENPITFVQFIMLGVRAQGAREELLKIRDRMKTGRVAKLQNNPYMVTSSQVPFGFEKYANPDYVLGQTPKSFIRINEDEAAIIRRCYEMAISGKSCQTIADFLNRSGYIHKNNKGEKFWQAAEVNRMLKKRLYIGERTIEGITHQITPIVSVEMFEQAAKCMIQKRCIVSKKEERFNPFKGLLFCGDCGLPFTMINQRGELVFKCLYDAYKHRNPNKTYQICHNSRVYYNKLMETVWSLTVERIQSNEYYGKSQLTIVDYDRQLLTLQRQIAQLIEERKPIKAEISKRLKQLETTVDPDIIELIEEKYKSLKRQITEIENKIKNIQTEFNKINIRRGDLAQELFWNKHEMSIHEKAEFFNKVIEKITWKSEKFKRVGKLIIYFKNGDSIEKDMINK